MTQAHECANFYEWKCAERPVAAFALLLSASQRGGKVMPWAGGGSNRASAPFFEDIILSDDRTQFALAFAQEY